MLWFTGYVNCSKHPIDTVTAISYNNNRKQQNIEIHNLNPFKTGL